MLQKSNEIAKMSVILQPEILEEPEIPAKLEEKGKKNSSTQLFGVFVG